VDKSGKVTPVALESASEKGWFRYVLPSIGSLVLLSSKLTEKRDSPTVMNR
jgi:hypothetical protein